MGMYDMAVGSVGREVVLVKDNRIIGEGYSQTSAHGMVSIEMRDDRAKALIEDSLQVKMWAKSFPEKKFKYSYFKFCTLTGIYIDMSQDDPDMLCPALEDVRVVDKFNLRFGMVPDTFKDVEGYRAIEKESEQENETNQPDPE